MSLIFEALQRSQDPSTGQSAWEAEELLRHVERQPANLRQGNHSLSQGKINDYAEEDICWSDSASIALEREERDIHASRGLESLNSFQSLKLQVPIESHLVSFKEDESLAAESFRFLGVKLRHIQRERALHKLLITSTIPGEGKSTVAANLAFVLAKKKQQRVLLLEGDVRRPSVLSMFGATGYPGLCEWLEGQQKNLGNIYRIEETNLWVLPTGCPLGNPIELLQSPRLTILMEQLPRLFDWIIVDSPPVLPLADTSIWMRLVDGVLLIVRQGVTQKGRLKRGLEAIDSSKLIGVLLNSSQQPIATDHYYYYKKLNNDSRSSTSNEP